MVVRIIKIVVAVLVITGAALYFIQSKTEHYRLLIIRDSDSGKVYGKWRLNADGEFSIEFVHSVHQSPVRETFRAENGMISPVRVRFISFGAGMQSDLEEGQSIIRDGEFLVITGYKASYKKLNYIVGTVSDHILFINDENIILRELCGRNAHISIMTK